MLNPMLMLPITMCVYKLMYYTLVYTGAWSLYTWSFGATTMVVKQASISLPHANKQATKTHVRGLNT